MTSKQTAIINTAKILGVAALAGTITSVLLMYVSLPLIGIGVCTVIMLFLIHMIYELELEKAKCLRAFEKHNAIQKFDTKSES